MLPVKIVSSAWSKKILRLLLLSLLTTALIYCSSFNERKVAQSAAINSSIDLKLLPEYLSALRNLYARTKMSTLQKLNIVESSVLEAVFNPDHKFDVLRNKFLLLNSPDFMDTRAAPQFLKEITGLLKQTVTSNGNMPLKPLRLIDPHSSKSGYRNLELLVNHAYGQVAASDLAAAWINFIKSTKKELMINVFDFDHVKIADAIVDLKSTNSQVNITVGIDAGVIKDRPEVAAIFNRLKEKNIKVIAVDSVGLNHQKIAIRDWSKQEQAAVLFSSGNLTYSCLDPLGDFHEYSNTVDIPKDAIPNANHLITMNSWLVAQITHHELSKTFDLKMRGRTLYPLNGSYQILQDQDVKDTNLAAFPDKSLLLTFTPNGATVINNQDGKTEKSISQSSVNQYLLSKIIKRFQHTETNKKPEPFFFRMAQFAFSAKEINQALFSLIESRGLQNTNLKMVGDRPFAMAEWSQFLDMSALERVKNKNKTVRYQISSDPEHPWKLLCNPAPAVLNSNNSIPTCLNENFENKIRSMIFVAPSLYGNHSAEVTIDGIKKNITLTSKIHHKIMSIRSEDRAEAFAVLGTSFNFSEGAETNNEQVLVFQDRAMAIAVENIVESLHQEAISVTQEANNRNLKTSNKDPQEEEEENRGESELRAVKTSKKKK